MVRSRFEFLPLSLSPFIKGPIPSLKHYDFKPINPSFGVMACATSLQARAHLKITDGTYAMYLFQDGAPRLSVMDAVRRGRPLFEAQQSHECSQSLSQSSASSSCRRIMLQDDMERCSRKPFAPILHFRVLTSLSVPLFAAWEVPIFCGTSRTTAMMI